MTLLYLTHRFMLITQSFILLSFLSSASCLGFFRLAIASRSCRSLPRIHPAVSLPTTRYRPFPLSACGSTSGNRTLVIIQPTHPITTTISQYERHLHDLLIMGIAPPPVTYIRTQGTSARIDSGHDPRATVHGLKSIRSPIITMTFS